MLFRHKHKLRIPFLRSGDIIGFSGDSWLSAGINLGTYGIPFWGLSHLGIIGELDGRCVLFESTTLSDLPCLIQGKKVDGTQAHEIIKCLEAYKGKVWHYPLSRLLYPFEKNRLNEFLWKHVGKSYDMIGAFRTGGVGFSWLEGKLRREDLSSLFCSEYCVAAHRCIGIFKTGNVSRWNPNRFVRAERRKGILKKPTRIK